MTDADGAIAADALAAQTAATLGTFDELGVIAPIVAGLTAVGFDHPFPIQHLAIPIALQGSDLIGQARTGTGKTLAFGIPLLQRIMATGQLGQPGAPQALVLCPTRELASQVSEHLEIVAAQVGAKLMTVYGGVGYEPQLDALGDGVDVVVATPGRLLDLMDRGTVRLGSIKVLVLDEADEMLDLGFLPDVERIIAQTPASRQTMLFSATMPAPIVALSRTHLHQPINIRAEAFDSSLTVPETTQFVYQAHDLDKPAIVGKLLQAPGAARVIVFCKTKRGVQRLADDLVERGFSATCIHGDLSQIVRERALTRFRAGKAQVIVATDVAARGIDVDQVTHVVNYDCPDDEKTYVHRIGRTGRAGNKGAAITLVDWTDLTRWKLINKALNLPFDEPLEAYSTTPQLLSDLGVPEGATGRLVPPRPPEERDQRPSRSDRGGPDGRRRRDDDRTETGSSPTAEASERRSDRTKRDRTRRRNGVAITPVSGPEPTAASPMTPDAADVVRETAVADDGPAKARRRRRRGSRTTTDALPTATNSPTAED